MEITDNSTFQPKKPGPLTRAAGGLSIGAPTDPDTDGSRQYSPQSGQAFAYRPEAAGIASGIDSMAIKPPSSEPTPLSGIAAPVVPGGNAPDKKIAAITAPGRNADGVITADSAQAAMGNPMTRSGGISGSIDMAGVNGILERENKARGEMIDLSIKANGGNGIAILPDPNEAANAERAQRWAIDDLSGRMNSAGTRDERAAYGQALNQTIAGQNRLALEATRQQGDLNQRGITAEIEKAKQAGIDQRAAERNQVQMRGQDTAASTAAERIASQERIAEQRKDSGKDFARIVGNTFSLNFMPQILAPIYEQGANRNSFTKAPIETPGMENVQPFMRAKPNTSETMRALGMATRNLPESMQVNPVRTEALLRGYLNTWAMYGLMLSDRAFFNEVGPEKRADELPVVRRFYAQEPARHTKFETEFYDMLGEAKRLQGTMRELDRQGRPEIADEKESSRLAGEAKPLERAQQNVKVINAEMMKTHRDKDLSPEQKRQRIDELLAEKNALLKATVQDAKAAQK